ncbi:MAG: DUF3152 domain-containing protein [Nocardioides sp.]
MRTALLVLVAAVLAVLSPAVPSSAAENRVSNVVAPRVLGSAVFGGTLRSDPGQWDPDDVELAYSWLRDGVPIGKASESTYTVRRADLGHRLSLSVRATHPDGPHAGSATAESEPTTSVRRGTQTNRARPKVSGVARFTRTVAATEGRWKTEPDRVAYRWLRDGEPIKGATSRTYRFVPSDVGHRVRVAVTSYVEGYRRATAISPMSGRVQHRVDVQRTVTYSVTTRGRITANVKEFALQARQTYADPRGWRAKGVQFRQVAEGGSFTLVLAEASTVPSFSSQCSSTYSCRVGRYVIINQTRWQQATPPWNSGGRSLRDYRHMVVNHETGHWLGKGHASCPGPGRLAPVMMQQSKGTNGCAFNPWPTAAELG